MSERDHSLIAEFNARRCEDAFAALVRQHVHLVFATALRQVGDHGTAEEITQNVFLALAESAGKLGSHPTIAGWLYQTTLNKSRERLRSDLRRRRREQVAVNLELAGAEGESVWASLVPLLDEALLELRESDRLTVVLHFMEGRTFCEVGSVLGIGEDAARKRANRCLDQLTAFFRRHGFGGPALTVGTPLFALSAHAAPAGLATSVATAGLAAAHSAASTSTLTLIKGALKIMAWTKMKIAAVTGAVLILATATTITAIYHQRHSPPHQTGRMKLPTGDVTPMIAYSSLNADVYILASDGSLWSLGENSSGSPLLGYTNVEKTTSLRRIGNDADWENIAVGMTQCLAVKSDGTLWAWGENSRYQLGDGTKIIRPTPVPSVPGNNWKQAACGAASGLALKNDGTLWAWGDNWAGQLGVGDTKATTSAVQVGTSTNWAKVWAGGVQTVGLQSDGSLWFWGSLSGSSSDKAENITVPTRVSPDTDWTDVCFGNSTVFALKSDGTLWTWGLKADIYDGGFDNGSGVQLTPVQIGTESDWQSFSSAPHYFYLLLRKNDGSLWALDASEHRKIKPASQYKPMAPRKIDFHKDIATYAAGGDNIGLILTPDGEVWTWGTVLGELTYKDYWAKRKQLFPKHKAINQPWQVFNIP